MKRTDEEDEEEEEDEKDEEEEEDEKDEEEEEDEEGGGGWGGESVENPVRGDYFKAKAKAKPRQAQENPQNTPAGPRIRKKCSDLFVSRCGWTLLFILAYS